jgi:hypothetical protein
MRTPAAIAIALVLVAPALPFPASANDPGFIVVAHPSVKANGISAEALSRAFLKKDTAWPDGQAIAVVEPAADAVRAAFAARVHRRSLAALRSYWNQMIFGGRDVPPVEKPSDAAVLEWVREHPGALGYVSAGAPTAGVRVLALD